MSGKIGQPAIFFPAMNPSKMKQTGPTYPIIITQTIQFKVYCHVAENITSQKNNCKYRCFKSI